VCAEITADLPFRQRSLIFHGTHSEITCCVCAPICGL
jgi:hypothetical protein